MNRLFFGVLMVAQVFAPCSSHARAYDDFNFEFQNVAHDSLFQQFAQATTPQTTEPQPIPAPNTATPPTTPSVPSPGVEPVPAPADPSVDEAFTDEESMGEIPAVETTELTVDLAKRAIDVYAIVKDKYKDSDIEAYENLQDFVEKDPQGRIFESDVKAAGFANVNDWNLAITTASFAYTNIIDDQTEDIKEQIAEITNDAEMDKESKDRMISSLNSMIPSANNSTVMQTLMKDPGYIEKVKLLQVEEE